MSIEMQSVVKVIHGSNDDSFPVAGATVAKVQENLADAFNIPIEAFAWVNGVIVGEDFRLRDNDTLEFIVPDGVKGAQSKADDSDFQPIKTPFPYYGGKSRVAPEIWRRFGDVKNYVEPFFGGGGVLLNRPLSAGAFRKETVNDIDALLANFWKAAKQHPRKLAKVADYPVSELDLHARHKWLTQKREAIWEKLLAEPAWCDPVVAAWWVWGISQWKGGGWCSVDSLSRRLAYVNGERVGPDYRLMPDDTLEFVYPWGFKGSDDLLSPAALMAWRRVTPEQYEELLRRGLPSVRAKDGSKVHRREDVHRWFAVVPAGAPAWVKADRIAETIRVWQPRYRELLTADDALEIMVNARNLLDVLFPLGTDSKEAVQ